MSKIHPDDPRLTAYALGELPRLQAREIERAALLEAGVQESLDELAETRDVLSEAYQAVPLQLGLDRRNLVHQAGLGPDSAHLVSIDRRRRVVRAIGVITAAAALITLAFVALQHTPVSHGDDILAKKPLTKEEKMRIRVLLEGVGAPTGLAAQQISLPEVPGEGENSRPADAEYQAVVQLIRNNPDHFFKGIGRERVMAALPEILRLPGMRENPFVSPLDVERTKIPVTSGTTGFKLVECFVRDKGELPPRATVRIEELINHVPYRDEGDARLDNIMLGAELMKCPWDERKVLLSVLVQNRTDRLLPPDAALTLAVNPEAVHSYRLIGYASGGDDPENALRRGLDPDKSNMVLYELIPSDPEVLYKHEILCRLNLELGGHFDRLLEVPVVSPPRDWNNASLNVRTAAVIAGYGMILRESDYRGELDAGLLRQLAQDVLEDSELTEPRHQDALQLVTQSLALMEVPGG